MELRGLTQRLFSIWTRKGAPTTPDYAVLPPVVEYRSLVRDGLDGFLAEEPISPEDLSFEPPEDCRPQRVRPVASARRESRGKLLSVRRADADPLKMGDLHENPQEFLLGLLYYLDEELSAELAQVEYHPRFTRPEAPPSPQLVSRTTRACTGGRNKERILTAATVLYPYLTPIRQARLEQALLRLLDALEVHQHRPEGEELSDADFDNIRRLVGAIDRAPNQYWQLLTLIGALRGIIGGIQQTLGVEPTAAPPALARAC